MENNVNQNLGWDDTIEQDGEEYILLPEGDYNFIITNFERGSFPGGQKIPPCNKASITYPISDQDVDSCDWVTKGPGSQYNGVFIYPQ